MKIGGFQPFSLSDFPGRPAAIVFSQGCNFRCPYCHNRQLWPRQSSTAPPLSPEDVLNFLAQRQGCLSGLVITGGEPTLQPDLVNFARDVKRLGMAVKLDTNGSRPEILEILLARRLVDYIAMDVKAPLAIYDRLCGVPVDPAVIRDAIHLIVASTVRYHFRTTFDRTRLSAVDLDAIKAMLPPRVDYRVQPCRKVH